jgi:DNA-binding response OmpR family regulator
LPHVFERFFQTNRPNKLAEGGTGIGLALCQEYAHLFKGTINVDSTLGQGAVFKVTFPVTRINTNNRIAVAPLAETADYVPGGTEFLMLTSVAGASDTPKPTLLLVEDNPDLRDYIRLVLQGKYQVFYAENGQNALDIIGIRASEQKKPITPDLILSDLMMPVMNGYQLLERLKADDATRHIPVIMLTARAETQDKLKALRIGVDDYLTKPFDEEELLARIENLLKNQAIRKQEAVVESGNERPLISQPDRQWLEAFEAHVQKHYASELISVASLAREFAMSESTLLRQLKRLTGLTPLQYLQEVRLEEARHLLENRSYLSVAQVAAQVGYEDTRFFSRSFRQRFGKLPSELLSA